VDSALSGRDPITTSEYPEDSPIYSLGCGSGQVRTLSQIPKSPPNWERRESILKARRVFAYALGAGSPVSLNPGRVSAD
jgi:hypothetical protein